MSDSIPTSRRRFLQAGAATAAGLVLPAWASSNSAPAIIAAESDRPQALQGLHFGDPSNGSVVVWSRSDRPARMFVEWSGDEQFREAQRMRGPHALDVTDFTARQAIHGLEAGSEVFVRVSFESLNNDRVRSAPVTGRFVVPPDPQRGEEHGSGRWQKDLRFAWSGDTAGQGWGINPSFGGMKIYEAMRQRHPLFFVHSGDNIYADGPIADSVVAEGGRLWTQHRHAAGGQGRRDAGRVPRPLPLQPARRERPALQRRGAADLAVGRPRGREQLVRLQGSLGRCRATPKRMCRCWSRAERAPFSNTRRCGRSPRESQRVYRRYSYGPLLELFVLDMRSYRGAQFGQPARRRRAAETAFLGPRAARLAEGGPAEFTGGVEGRRRRHAARPERRRRQRRPRGRRSGRRSPTANPARPRGASSSSPSCSVTSNVSECATWSG